MKMYLNMFSQKKMPSFKDVSSIPAQDIKDRAYNTSGYRIGEQPQAKIMISNEVKELIGVITKKYE